MPSNYEQFRVMIDTDDGPVPAGENVDVHVRQAGETTDETESPLSTNADGVIEAGELANVAAGTLVYFRVEDEQGLAGSVAQITTA